MCINETIMPAAVFSNLPNIVHVWKKHETCYLQNHVLALL